MDFPTAWKASSIVLTGAFGILGLVKNVRDKATDRITRWGYASLAGILISTSFGVVAQLIESSKEERAKKATALQTLQLAEKSDRTLSDIQKVLSPLDIRNVSISFEVPCEDHTYVVFCKNVLEQEENSIDNQQADVDLSTSRFSNYWRLWPHGRNHFITMLWLRFFLSSQKAKDYFDGNVDLTDDLSLNVDLISYGKDATAFIGPITQERKVLVIVRAIPNHTPDSNDIFNPGKIKSSIELEKSTVILEEHPGENMERMKLTLASVTILLKNGEMIGAVGPFEKKLVYHTPTYRFQFAKQP